jgi:histidinol-phosphate aminotransferase
MSRYWSHVVHGLTPYVPGEQPRLDNLVKLNTNEHPYGPSPRALAAIQSAAVATLRLYPDPNAEALKTALAEYHGLRPDQVFVGNGSDEVLAHAFMALLNQERPLWFPDITYSFYPVYCGLYGIQSETIPLAEDFSIRAQDYLPTPHRRAGGIIFPNPNAPTGRFMTLADVEQVVAANAEVVVVIDEAYVDFGGDSAVGLVERYPNLLVVQTFSKSRALAGLRVGFALGHPALIEALERVKNSFNSYPLDRLALAGAVASVQDEAYFQESRRKVMATRANLVAGMAGLGFEVLPSTANFIFTRHSNWEAAELALALRQRAIIVRHFRLPRIDQFLRITVGTDDQCAILISALAELLRD